MANVQDILIRLENLTKAVTLLSVSSPSIRITRFQSNIFCCFLAAAIVGSYSPHPSSGCQLVIQFILCIVQLNSYLILTRFDALKRGSLFRPYTSAPVCLIVTSLRIIRNKIWTRPWLLFYLHLTVRHWRAYLIQRTQKSQFEVFTHSPGSSLSSSLAWPDPALRDSSRDYYIPKYVLMVPGCFILGFIVGSMLV